MPIYELSCPNCPKTTEVIVRCQDFQLPICPDCFHPMRLLPSTFHIRGPFHWYKASDYQGSNRGYV